MLQYVPNDLATIVPMLNLRVLDSNGPDSMRACGHTIIGDVVLGDTLVDPLLNNLLVGSVEMPKVSLLDYFMGGASMFEALTLIGDAPSRLTPQEEYHLSRGSSSVLHLVADAIQSLKSGPGLGTKDLNTIPPYEHSSHHLQYHGTVLPPPVDSLYNLQYPKENTGDGMVARTLQPHQSPGGLTVVSHVGSLDYWGGRWNRLTTLAALLEDNVGKTWSTVQMGCTTDYTLVEYDHTFATDGTQTRTIQYVFRVRRWGMGRGKIGSFVDLTYRRSITLTYWYDWLLFPDIVNPATFSTPFHAHIRIRVKTLDLYGSSEMRAPDVEPPYIFSWLNKTLSFPRQDYVIDVRDEQGDSHEWGLGMFSKSAELAGPSLDASEFEGVIRGLGSEIRANNLTKMHKVAPLAAIAAGDALQSHVDITGVNLLENVVEWEQLFKLPCSMTQLRRVFNKLQQSDPTALLDIGSVYANGVLWSEFGVQPLVDDVKSYIKHWNQIVNVLRGRGLWGVKTLYGSHRLSGVTEHFRVPVDIDIHCKAVVVFEHNVLLTMILKLNAVGLMPRLANLWDCLPWSFAVDWFTNEGQRLNDVDWQGGLLLLPCKYTVSSVKLTHHIPNDVLPGYDVSEATITDYYRWCRDYFPGFGLDTYDPHPLVSVEDALSGHVKVAGALAYVNLKPGG